MTRPNEQRPTTLRLFYAIKVPPQVAAPLAQAQRHLRGNWRSVRADQFHITLAYLPSVPPQRVAALRELGLRAAREQPPLPLQLRGTGYFPNEGSPRVWFVKAEAPGLAELADELRKGISDLGLGTDEQPFKPHVTLARKKGPAPRVFPMTFDHSWQASQLVLYRSILRKTGPIYEVESTFKFRGLPLEAPLPSPSPVSPDEVHHE